jgi:hypothetical protein
LAARPVAHPARQAHLVLVLRGNLFGELLQLRFEGNDLVMQFYSRPAFERKTHRKRQNQDGESKGFEYVHR